MKSAPGGKGGAAISPPDFSSTMESQQTTGPQSIRTCSFASTCQVSCTSLAHCLLFSGILVPRQERPSFSNHLFSWRMLARPSPPYRPLRIVCTMGAPQSGCRLLSQQDALKKDSCDRAPCARCSHNEASAPNGLPFGIYPRASIPPRRKLRPPWKCCAKTVPIGVLRGFGA